MINDRRWRYRTLLVRCPYISSEGKRDWRLLITPTDGRRTAISCQRVPGPKEVGLLRVLDESRLGHVEPRSTEGSRFGVREETR